MNLLLFACIAHLTQNPPQESTLNLQLPAAHSTSGSKASNARGRQIKREFEEYVNRKRMQPAIKRRRAPLSPANTTRKADAKEMVVGRLGLVYKASTIYYGRSPDSDIAATVAEGTYIAVNSANGEWYGVLMSDRSTGWISKDEVQLMNYEVVNNKDPVAPKPEKSRAVYFDVPAPHRGDSTTRRLTRSLLKAANQYIASALAAAGSSRVERLVDDSYARHGPVLFVAYSHNIVKTNSLTSPYIAYVEVKRFQRSSHLASSREEAMELPLSVPRDETVVVLFAYQEGVWICKGTQ